METIRNSNQATSRKATISDNAPYWHVVFFITDEIASRRQPGRMYKTLSSARKAAQIWVDGEK